MLHAAHRRAAIMAVALIQIMALLATAILVRFYVDCLNECLLNLFFVIA